MKTEEIKEKENLLKLHDKVFTIIFVSFMLSLFVFVAVTKLRDVKVVWMVVFGIVLVILFVYRIILNTKRGKLDQKNIKKNNHKKTE
jgi:lipopolysaccharide export LptBFGC system permease protein LptF